MYDDIAGASMPRTSTSTQRAIAARAQQAAAIARWVIPGLSVEASLETLEVARWRAFSQRRWGSEPDLIQRGRRPREGALICWRDSPWVPGVDPARRGFSLRAMGFAPPPCGAPSLDSEVFDGCE